MQWWFYPAYPPMFGFWPEHLPVGWPGEHTMSIRQVQEADAKSEHGEHGLSHLEQENSSMWRWMYQPTRFL